MTGKTLLTLLVAAGWTLLGYSAVAARSADNVPVLASYASAPRTFTWNSTQTYRIKLTSKSSRQTAVKLTFMPYIQLMPGAEGANGKGGVDSYDRLYTLRAGESRIISFRLRTWTGFPNMVYWCLQTDLAVGGTGPQSIHTCALPAGK